MADPTAGLMDAVGAALSPGVVIIVLVLVALLAGLWIAVGWVSSRDNSHDPESLEDRIDDKIIDPAKTFGLAVDRSIFYGIKKIGVVMNAYKSKTKKGEEYIETEADMKDVDADKVDNELKTYTFVARPHSTVDQFLWLIVDEFIGYEKYTKYIDVPRDAIESIDPLMISDDVPLTKSGQLYRADSSAGYTSMQHKTMTSTLENVLETFQELSEDLQSLNLQYVEDVAKMQREYEEKKRYWSNKDEQDRSGATD